jgi:nucleoside-triphosphatase
LIGRPGVGKTTCIRKLLELLRVPAGGFVTEEIREADKRVGFSLRTLDGRQAILAHIDRSGGPRVGKYGVNLDALDRVGVPAIREAVRRGRLVVIDEIGKMELAGAAFRQAVEEALESPATVLATILMADHPWADRIKLHPAVQLIEVTRANREPLPARLAAWLRSPPLPAA